MMANPGRNVLIVFARAPVSGTVKTRLIPLLGADGAAAFHRHMVEHTLTVTSAVAGVKVELHCSPTQHDSFFASCANRFGVILRNQRGDDLGERMFAAIENALTRGAAVVLIGTDCPSLVEAHIESAYALLDTGNDAVLGPACDEGYYLIGLRRCPRELFSGIAWGTSTVLGATRERLQGLNYRWAELETMSDIDRPEDYLTFRKGLNPSHVIAS